jgi:hypothetical protein
MSAVMVTMAVLIRTFSSGILAGRGGTYRKPVRHVTKTWSVVLLNKKMHILLSQVYDKLLNPDNNFD